MKHLGDITKISGAEIPVVDVITGGSPCQDLSVAGLRKGMKHEANGDYETTRSGLFLEQIRIVKEMREKNVRSGRNPAHARPRYMVWENVPGAFSSGNPKGADFAAVLEEIIKVAEPGTDVRVRVPDGGWTKSGCYYAEDGTWSVAWRVHDAQFWGVPQRRKRIALVADFGGLSAPEILFERKGLSRYSEPGKAQGEATAGSVGSGATAAGFKHKASGTARGIGYEEEKAPSLIAGQESAVYDARGNGNGETVPTLTGDHKNRVTDYTALCVGNGQLNQMSMAEQANTLDTMHDQHAVMVAAVDCRNGTENSDINGTLQAKSTGGIGVNFQNVCRTGSVVRRLTPLECERLQGYPDGWTDIGDWVDSNGKKHKTADSPRYKALGNSIALPFWFWLLRRISAQYERPATLGSLFDGIGGFPLSWAEVNGSDSVIWASEIEEFPIAVTKKHFGDDDAGIEGDIQKYL